MRYYNVDLTVAVKDRDDVENIETEGDVEAAVKHAIDTSSDEDLDECVMVSKAEEVEE